MAELIHAERTIEGKKLVCPVCKGVLFWTRETLMNTAALTFFNLDFANRAAQNCICSKCGYVYWFMKAPPE